MSNYKETTVLGSKWQRCRCVTIVNDYQKPPIAYFQEEEVISLGDSASVTKDVGSVVTRFAADGTIPLLDPVTGLPTGSSITHSELYAIVFSAYRQAAAARDSALEIPPPPPAP